MKTISTFKNRLTPHLLNLSALVLLISVPAMSQVKHVVNVSDFKFTPKELQISVGDTVEWQNTQGYHNVNGTTVTFPLNPESFGNSEGLNWTYKHVFNTIGFYDYHCDPHALDGMTGKIEVKESNGNDDKYKLTINFMGMTPHVDQILWLEVVDKSSEKKVERKNQIVSTDFSVDVTGIEKEHSYFVNFYADHNGNGSYDTPPVDHAWQLELNDVLGDTILNFQHNTSFTDIMWKNKLTVHFMNMTPHVGQTMKLAVTDKNTGMELSRVTTIASVDFMVDIYGIENGSSYNVDFYADHNGNGAYDVPPTDHAWRMELNDVANDTVLNFTHNTSFTDIEWKNELAVHFMDMTPHVGQNLTLWIIDRETGMAVDSVMTTAQTEFMIYSKSLLTGKSYNIDFFADHNGNGSYDAPPTDHAWRIKLDNVKSDTMLMFQHNTSFTDIMAKNTLTVHFMGMNPHVGQNLHLAVIDKNSGKEIQRVNVIASVEFMVNVPGIELGKSYNVDFFADHNGNGQYDAPPADHAWRLELNDVMGDTTLNFQHNTSFTDIMWKNKLMVHFMGMNPHVGQNLQLAVIEKTSGMEVQRVSVTASVDFWVSVYGIENGMSYNVDFYADHNSNGMYDAPPVDHAWRLELNDVMGDTTLNFQHNTSFTDINWISTAISEFNNSSFKMYPNPATGRVFIESNEFNSTVVRVMIYDISGKLKISKIYSPQQVLEIDIHKLVNGMYFVELRNENKREMFKLIKY